jgi:hypothetical protein
MTATVAAHPAGGHVHAASLWLSITAFATAFVALAVWFVVTVASANTSSGSTPRVLPGDATGQYNQLCAPAPGTNFC